MARLPQNDALRANFEARPRGSHSKELIREILHLNDHFHNPSLDEAPNSGNRELQAVTYVVTITKRGDARPFWLKVVLTRATAEHVASKNQGLIDQHGWEHTIEIKEVP